MLFIWVYVAAVDIIQARSILVQAAINADEDIEDLETSLRFGFAIGRLACLTAYLLTLLPSGDPLDDGGSRYVELPVNNDEREPMLGRYSILETGEGSGIDNEDQYSIHYFDGRSENNIQQGSNQRQGTIRRTMYGGFPVLAPSDPSYLGIAKENTPLLSRLLFYWVHPLIKKGRLGRLKSAEDLFDVPVSISAPIVSDKFQQAKENMYLYKNTLCNKYNDYDL